MSSECSYSEEIIPIFTQVISRCLALISQELNKSSNDSLF